MSESHSEPAGEPVRDGRNSGVKSKKGRRQEELRNSQEKRPESSTRRSQLVRGVALPLTLFAQWARAAVANAGRIDHAQAAISLWAPLLNPKRLSCGTAQRPIRLERKVGTGEAPRFPGSGAGGWTIPGGGR